MDKNTRNILISLAAVAVLGLGIYFIRGNDAAPADQTATTTPAAPEVPTLSGAVVSVAPATRMIQLRGDGGNVPVQLSATTTITNAAGASTTLASLTAGTIVRVTGKWADIGPFLADSVQVESAE